LHAGRLPTTAALAPRARCGRCHPELRVARPRGRV